MSNTPPLEPVSAVIEQVAANTDERIVTIAEEVVQPFDYSTEPATAQVVEVKINEGVPTQVANPSRASWRTFVQSLIPALVVVNAAVPIVYAFLTDPDVAPQLERILGPVYLWILAACNVVAILLAQASKLLALLMANPTVNEFIVRRLPWLAPIKPS